MYRYLDGKSPVVQNLDQANTSVSAFNDDASLLAFALTERQNNNCAVRLFSRSNNETVRDFPCEGIPSALAISPEGKFLALGTEEGVITLWDVGDGSVIHTLAGHQSRNYDLAFDTRSQLLASAGCVQKDVNNCPGGEIIIWDIQTGAQKVKFLGHSNLARTVAFSPDGSILASGSRDGNILLWDIEKQSQSDIPLVGHASYVNTLVFSPDGSVLASASADLRIILWDVQLQHRIGNPLVGHTSSIGVLAFNHNGNLLISGDNHGNIYSWNISSQSLAENLCAKIGRNFTLVEWMQYFPDEFYRATCPQSPIDPDPTLSP